MIKREVSSGRYISDDNERRWRGGDTPLCLARAQQRITSGAFFTLHLYIHLHIRSDAYDNTKPRAAFYCTGKNINYSRAHVIVIIIYYRHDKSGLRIDRVEYFVVPFPYVYYILFSSLDNPFFNAQRYFLYLP